VNQARRQECARQPRRFARLAPPARARPAFVLARVPELAPISPPLLSGSAARLCVRVFDLAAASGGERAATSCVYRLPRRLLRRWSRWRRRGVRSASA
jgi:hypothetical protein